MSRARVVRTLYRNLLRQARRADADVILRHQISKQPVDVLQVASAGLGRSCRSINVKVGGSRGRIPRLHAIYDRDCTPADSRGKLEVNETLIVYSQIIYTSITAHWQSSEFSEFNIRA